MVLAESKRLASVAIAPAQAGEVSLDPLRGKAKIGATQKNATVYYKRGRLREGSHGYGYSGLYNCFHIRRVET
jgi:hypothetical protein